VDRDGALPVDELVEVMRREMVVSDRKLFRNMWYNFQQSFLNY
jgi:hypothetical protein